MTLTFQKKMFLTVHKQSWDPWNNKKSKYFGEADISRIDLEI